MLYLTGVLGKDYEDYLISIGIGLMCQPRSGYENRIPKFDFWAGDNGAFTSKWTEDHWMRWLARLPTDRCLFAVSPDVYPDAGQSLERGLEYAPYVRELGFPTAIVAQDGAEELDWPWEEIDCLFIGGESSRDRTARGFPTTPKQEWKTSLAAQQLVAEARKNGKWTHMGRCNSFWRLERAREMGVHSVDGTFLKFAPDINVPRLERFFDKLDYHRPLPLQRFEGASHPNHRRAEAMSRERH